MYLYRCIYIYIYIYIYYLQNTQVYKPYQKNCTWLWRQSNLAMPASCTLFWAFAREAVLNASSVPTDIIYIHYIRACVRTYVHHTYIHISTTGDNPVKTNDLFWTEWTQIRQYLCPASVYLYTGVIVYLWIVCMHACITCFALNVHKDARAGRTAAAHFQNSLALLLLLPAGKPTYAQCREMSYFTKPWYFIYPGNEAIAC